jgi:hypothetical protein
MFGVSLGIIDSGGAGGGGASFESIATAVGTGSSGTITFSSIPSTYKHLQVRLDARVTVANLATSMRVNNDSSSLYARHALFGTGASVSAAGSASQTSISWIDFVTGSNSAANIEGVGILDIHDYASTTKTKTIRLLGGYDTNNGSDGGLITLQSGLYNSTSAITRLDFLVAAGNWATSTTFSLYGIKG